MATKPPVPSIREQLTVQLQEARNIQRVHEAMMVILQTKYNPGKKLTARITQQLADYLGWPREVFRLEYIASMAYLNVWGQGSPWPNWESKLRIFLGYDKDFEHYGSALYTERSHHDQVRCIAELEEALATSWPEDMEDADALLALRIAEAKSQWQYTRQLSGLRYTPRVESGLAK